MFGRKVAPKKRRETMQKLIDTSSAFYGAGNAPTMKMFTVAIGPYSGRRMVIYATAPSTLKFSYADAPHTSWSVPQTITSNAADYPVSGCIDQSGNVYVVYSELTTLNLLLRRLTFVAGLWTVGSEIAIYNDKDNYFPSIVKDVYGKLTVSWTCYDSVADHYSIRSKQSVNEGLIWGAGPTDEGTALTTGSTGCYG